MSVHLIPSPAASGKTRDCIERVRTVLRTSPLSKVWVVLPDSSQATAFRRRLAEQGGALGAHIGTFADLHAEILVLAGTPLPVAPEPVIHRLALAAIDATAQAGFLHHYESIQHKPGLVQALARLVAELKRARIEPRDFANVVQGRGERLEELAKLFDEYQNSLIRLGWADVEGLGWLAVQTLKKNTYLVSDWKLLIADGFDILYPTQLETLKLLSDQVGETILTLTGDLQMERTAYRRFKRTLARIQNALDPQIEPLKPPPGRVAPLAHLEKSLFEADSAKVKPGNQLTFIEAQTPALEAREALRWIKARIHRDGVRPQDCAIIARDIAPYRPYLRQVGIEFGLPLRFAGGESLSGNPAIATILNLLELALTGWRRRSLIDALRSPYLDRSRFDLRNEDAFRFDQVAHWGQIVEGLEQWQDSFTRLAQQTAEPKLDTEEGTAVGPPQLPREEEAARLWSALQKFAQRSTPPERATVVTFVEWLEDLISAEQGFAVIEQAHAQSDTAPRDQSALIALKDILRALVLSEKIVGDRGEITLLDFYTDLRAAIEGGTYIPEDSRERTQSRILCASLPHARGIAFRAVALLGLSEGIFPAPVDEDPFLPEEDRRRLGARNLAIEERLRSDQASLFYEAVTRASDFLLLTRPYLADDGEAWLPSPYWNSVRALFELEKPLRVRTDSARSLADSASLVELLTAAVRQRNLPARYSDFASNWKELRHSGSILHSRLAKNYRGPFDGELAGLANLLASKYGPRRVWSASRLETYAQCGFRFLLGDAFELEAVETPAEGYDAAQLGSMLHAILETVYQRAADPTNLEEVLQELPAVASQVFDQAPSEYGFRPTLLWNEQRKELLTIVEKTLRALGEEEAGFQPIHFEAVFGDPPLEVDTLLGPILFHGRIDRVDADDAKNLRVIDYKTGGITKYNNKDLGKGLHLQLVLYALGVNKTLKLGRVTDAFYWGILKGKPSSLRLSGFEYTDPDDGQVYAGLAGATKLVTKHIATHIDGIRKGIFVPAPQSDDKCPDYCVAKTICWHYEPSEH